MKPFDKRESRHNIEILSGAAMVAGAALAVVALVVNKVDLLGTTTVWAWEALLYGLLGATPGWLLRGVLLRRFHPETHADHLTRQPRCNACGAILSRAGERCPDCGGHG